jgi:integrase
LSKEVNEERTPRTVADVKEMLTKHSNGEIQRTIQNCITILQNDHVLADAIRLNLLSERIDIVKPVGWPRSGKTLNDTDMKYILRRMEKYGISSEKKIESAIRIVANENRYHPIRDYLNGLKWDGTERIAHVLRHFLGAAEDEYTCEAMKIFLLGAVKRVFQPGCKFETMLCLVGGQGAGKSTQNVLHQVFAVAVDDEYIRVNPTDGVLTAIKAAHQYETPKRHALTLPQQQAFLNFIKKTPKFQHWLPMFTFMLGTGCRISETVGLCWGDIDFESGFITIQHNLVYHDHEVGGCYFTMSTPKTAAGKRAIPILPEVRKALEQERTNQQELELVCEYEIDGISDFVFLNRFGQPQNPQTVNRAIKRISVAYNEAELEKAEKEKREPQLLPPFSCHNLRHTFCTRLCENETNLKIIQDIMGHKDISTTMEIYAEATKEAKAHSFANLNGKLGISV